MKNPIYLILLLSLFIQCNSQEKTVEEVYQDCYFNAMPNNGEKFKSLAELYEKALIREGYLNDSSGKSYFYLFKKIFEPDFIDNKTHFRFIDSVNKLPYIELIRLNTDCSKKMKALPYYDSSRTRKLEKDMDSVMSVPGFDIVKHSNRIVDLYEEKDFELDYYKTRVLLMIPDEIPIIEKEEKITSKEREKSLTIEVIDKKRVVINGENKSIKSIRPTVSKYIKSNKKHSLIILATKRDVLYANFILIQNEIISSINKLKNELAQSKFGKNYENITNQQKELINKEYSFKIVDETIE